MPESSAFCPKITKISETGGAAAPLALPVRTPMHPKVVSASLRDGFRARDVFGSLEKRTGPKSRPFSIRLTFFRHFLEKELLVFSVIFHDCGPDFNTQKDK